MGLYSPYSIDAGFSTFLYELRTPRHSENGSGKQARSDASLIMKKSFEFFPKDKSIRLEDAFIYWLFFGIFGGHQFYLGNKKRALYLLCTSGITSLLVVLLGLSFQGSQIRTILIVIFLLGGILSTPVLVWDILTLSRQVRDKKGQSNSL